MSGLGWLRIFIFAGLFFIFFGTMTGKVSEMVHGTSMLGEQEINDEILVLKTGISVVEHESLYYTIETENLGTSAFVQTIKLGIQIGKSWLQSVIDFFGQWFSGQDAKESLVQVLTPSLVIGCIVLAFWFMLSGFRRRGVLRNLQMTFITLIVLMAFFTFFQPCIEIGAKFVLLFDRDTQASEQTVRLLRYAIVEKGGDDQQDSSSALKRMLGGSDDFKVKAEDEFLSVGPSLDTGKDGTEKGFKQRGEIIKRLTFDLYTYHSDGYATFYPEYVKSLVQRYHDSTQDGEKNPIKQKKQKSKQVILTHG